MTTHKVPTRYLREKVDNCDRFVDLLNGDNADNFVVLTNIIHNANSNLVEAKKWQKGQNAEG